MKDNLVKNQNDKIMIDDNKLKKEDVQKTSKYK